MNTMFIDFVNSCWDADHGSGGDFLRDLTRFNTLLRMWGLPPQTVLTTEQSQELVALRELLTDAVIAIAKGTAPAAGTLAQLNANLAAGAVHYVLEPTSTGCQATLLPTSETDGLPSALVRSFAQFTMEHDLTRLRICANPDCHWVFYDESRNASRRFCADDCSSLIRVRRYRARRR